MNKKYVKLFQPNIRLYLLGMLLFAGITAFFDWRVAAAEGGLTLILLIVAFVNHRRRSRRIRSFIESVTYNAESATNNTLMNFPLPMVVFRLNDGSVVWGNHPFWELCGHENPRMDGLLSELVPGFSGKWLLEGKEQMPELLELNGMKYRVHGNMVRSTEAEDNYEFMGITYWVDVTDYEDTRLEYHESRPTEMVIVVDNYDELLKQLTDRQRTEVRGRIDAVMEAWSAGKAGIMRRYDRDRYVFITERRYLDEVITGKFALVDDVHKIVAPGGIHATVSIGVGMDGVSFEENHSFATLAVEMALSRGGDQAVVKNKFNFEFYGGRAAEVETRTKVKSRVMASSLSRLIQDASHVYVMGHRYADLDTIGAAAGICCLCRSYSKECRIVLGDGPNASGLLINSLTALDEYRDVFLSPADAMLLADRNTLLIVVDTARPEQVEDLALVESCNRIAVIDHHRRTATYINNATMTLYEPYASSACELVTEILQELLEPSAILPREADAILSGIVLDTKNFTLRTGERTFDAAAFLRRAGADTTNVKLLLQSDLEEVLARYAIIRQAKVYHGVAVAAAQETASRVVASQAADELLNIHGVTASVVLYPNSSNGVDISARSIGEINVQVLLEGFGGGGNKSAAGAQIPDISMRDAVNRLFAAIDRYSET